MCFCITAWFCRLIVNSLDSIICSLDLLLSFKNDCQ
ncbi:hypothetical protein GLYMA_14G211150v4 [Glycine max]|nr:hypothetical protein GLYMA_14G211150v4 [Glycine max]KAH1095578.1 hypothetical protein GYH30_040733 [Glycine max]